MDVDYFLFRRTAFIRSYYSAAVGPFEKTIGLIEREEAPYEPPYSEDGGEPAFLEEWTEAKTAIQFVGRTSVSMLSESLKVYLQTWDKFLGLTESGEFKSVFKKKGYREGYKACIGKFIGIDWSACSANLSVIEQLALARNQSQHAPELTTLSVRHPEDIRQKFPNPLFIRDEEKMSGEDTPLSLFGLEMVISRETLFEAVDEVELLVRWIEPHMQLARWPSALFSHY